MNKYLNYNESPTKTKKRNEILNNAMNVFIREGIHPVTMQDIAKECGISLRSLYYYYKNKEELAIDIQIMAFNPTWMNIVEFNENYTTYDYIIEFIDKLVDYIFSNQKEVKYITAFDFYFHNEYPTKKYNDYLDEIFQNQSMSSVLNLDDGSVNTVGEDIRTTVATVFHSIMAFAQRYIYREKAMITEDAGNRGNVKQHAELIKIALKKR